MKFLLLITAYLLISKLFAEELKITDINQVSNKASNSLLPPEIGCPEKCNEGSKENCSSIVENFCDTLWNSTNNGNLIRNGSSFNIGDSKVSEVSQILLIDEKVFVDSFEKFPSLLKNNKKLKDLIERERTILKNESSTKKWKESLEEAMEDISKEIGKIITRRQDEIYPELENTKGQDLSNNDLEKLLTVNYEITNKILEAKYKESSQWKRIEKIYNSIKESFYKVIDQRNIEKYTPSR